MAAGCGQRCDEENPGDEPQRRPAEQLEVAAGDVQLSFGTAAFMDKFINFLAAKHFIKPAMLFEAHFTDISTSGLMGVFSEGDARQIIEVIERINVTAVA